MTDIPSWIKVIEHSGQADCSICRTGVTAPPMFGPIPRAEILAAFVAQHATHTKTGRPSGLTSSGKVSRAARAVLS